MADNQRHSLVGQELGIGHLLGVNTGRVFRAPAHADDNYLGTLGLDLGNLRTGKRLAENIYAVIIERRRVEIGIRRIRQETYLDALDRENVHGVVLLLAGILTDHRQHVRYRSPGIDRIGDILLGEVETVIRRGVHQVAAQFAHVGDEFGRRIKFRVTTDTQTFAAIEYRIEVTDQRQVIIGAIGLLGRGVHRVMGNPVTGGD